MTWRSSHPFDSVSSSFLSAPRPKADISRIPWMLVDHEGVYLPHPAADLLAQALGARVGEERADCHRQRGREASTTEIRPRQRRPRPTRSPPGTTTATIMGEISVGEEVLDGLRRLPRRCSRRRPIAAAPCRPAPAAPACRIAGYACSPDSLYAMSCACHDSRK